MELLYIVRHNQLFYTSKGIWETIEGEQFYVEELKNSHLMNIPPYLHRNNRKIPISIMKEIISRNMYIDKENDYKVFKKETPSNNHRKTINNIRKNKYSWKR